MGILPDHQPILTLFKEGVVTVTDMNDEKHEFEVTDGFISFDSNKLTVAVERGRGRGPPRRRAVRSGIERQQPRISAPRAQRLREGPIRYRTACSPHALFRSREAAGRGMGYGGGLCES